MTDGMLEAARDSWCITCGTFICRAGKIPLHYSNLEGRYIESELYECPLSTIQSRSMKWIVVDD
jgi:hypothetical protein